MLELARTIAASPFEPGFAITSHLVRHSFRPLFSRYMIEFACTARTTAFEPIMAILVYRGSFFGGVMVKTTRIL